MNHDLKPLAQILGCGLGSFLLLSCAASKDGGQMADAGAAGTAIVSGAGSEESIHNGGGEVAVAATVVRTPWSFNGTEGLQLSSPNYEIFTTGRKSWMQEFAATFAERALAQYRTTLAELPAPPRALEIFLFARRSEWQDQTRELMQEHASLYLNLGRGGYSTRGTAVLYDIGFHDTFAILAHEGWHQYTQVAFKQPLPTWLEEGLAAYMEGRRPGFDDDVVFEPWSNPQRLAALERAVWRDRDIPLTELLDRSPQYFLEHDTSGLLTYYAQVWALAHFLVIGENGRYRDGLARLLSDASTGRLSTKLFESPHLTPALRRRSMTTTFGPGVILAYFNDDFPEFQQQYADFVRQIVDSRGAILKPVATAAAD